MAAWKVSKYGVFSGPNTGKYGPEKTPCLETFPAVYLSLSLSANICSFLQITGLFFEHAEHFWTFTWGYCIYN